MIVYGKKSKELASELLTSKCENCGTQHSIDMHVFQNYVHLFWIPFLPAGKTGISECAHCKQVLNLKEMPDLLKESYDCLKATTKTPIWTFAGIALVAVLMAIGIISDKKKDAKNAQLILTPQSGDVYEIKTTSNQYTLYKIDQVEGDSVFVRFSNFETNQSSGINELKQKGDSAYSDELLVFSKAELKQMLGKEEIRDVIRASGAIH